MGFDQRQFSLVLYLKIHLYYNNISHLKMYFFSSGGICLSLILLGGWCPGIWNGDGVGGDEEITQIPCSCFYKPGKGFVDFYEVFWP